MIYNKLSLFILFCFLLSNCAVAQKRFKDEVFTAIDSTSNIQYGQAINLNGVNQALLLDVFLPHGADTLAHRPLVIFIHGGGFQSNTKNGAFSSRLCATFAKRGYVAASIDYRLGIEGTKSNKDYAESMYRAQQDGKAAVRFFRRYAEKYGVDTSQIFVAGSSAGSKTCLAMAYMKQADVPKEISTDRWGTLEGNSGNNGYSSKVQGVITCFNRL